MPKRHASNTTDARRHSPDGSYNGPEFQNKRIYSRSDGLESAGTIRGAGGSGMARSSRPPGKAGERSVLGTDSWLVLYRLLCVGEWILGRWWSRIGARLTCAACLRHLVGMPTCCAAFLPSFPYPVPASFYLTHPAGLPHPVSLTLPASPCLTYPTYLTLPSYLPASPYLPRPCLPHHTCLTLPASPYLPASLILPTCLAHPAFLGQSRLKR